MWLAFSGSAKLGMHNDALGRDLASELSWVLSLICVLYTSRMEWIQVLEHQESEYETKEASGDLDH
jgi:hypothetical protein